MNIKAIHPVSPVLHDLDYEQVATLDQELTAGDGWEFYSNGQIKCATVFENKISGRVGNFIEEYEIEIVVSGKEIRSSCNCSRTGVICKHVIALLYSWVNDTEGFTDVGDSLQELRGFKRERLIEIVTNIIRHDPKNIERFLHSEPAFDEPDYDMSGFTDE